MNPLTIPFLILPFLGTNQPAVHQLASHAFSLQNRYQVESVNTVFKDNILLAINYTKGDKIDPSHVEWDKIEKPFQYKLTLKPGETFAFHDDVLPEYIGKVNKTTNAHFNFSQGFKSDGYLTGDGVCHLASLLYWVAKDANLDAVAPTRHDFAAIPDVPKEYGVSIYESPEKSESNETQNLYITNNKNKKVAFDFDYDGNKLTIAAVEEL